MTPIELLSEVFGRFDGHWRPAIVSAESVDVTYLRPAIQSAAKLSEPKQHAVILRYIHGWDFKSIGSRLGVSRERARQLCASGVRILRLPYNRKHIERHVPGSFNRHRLS